MDLRFLGMAFTMGCLAVTPKTQLVQGSYEGSRSQANGSAPRSPTATRSETVRPTTAGRAPRTRSHAARRGRVIAAGPYPVAADAGGSDAVDTVPAPAAVTMPGESSSIQPLQPSAPPQPSQAPPRGNLWLAVGPSTAQVYVDGFYIGTVDDAHRSPAGVNLAAGWHRLEFRAPAYETLAVNVTIDANRGTSYQGELRPTRP